MNYLLIWDIDGTLIQGKGIGRKSFNIAFHDLYGTNEAFDNIQMAGMLDSVIVEHVFESNTIIIPNFNTYSFKQDEETIKLYDRYCEILGAEVEKLSCSIAAPGVIELLTILSKKDNIYNVLGTGNIEKGARIKLSLDNLNKFFPTGGFGDEKMERWQVMEKAYSNAVSHFGIEFIKESVFVIGDTPLDIKCGKKFNTKTIGVATGPYTFTDLQNCGADYVFNDFTDIDSFLNIFKEERG